MQYVVPHALVRKVLFTWLVIASALLLSIVSLTSHASESSPHVLMKNVAENLFGDIAKLTPEQRTNLEVMRNIVAKDLMPYVDYKYASYKVMGKYIRQTTKQQRENFVAAMREYLVSTYASALTKYTDQQVIFEPAQEVGNQRIVTIHSEIVKVGEPTINIDFKLRKNKKTGEWKAFDMVVEGISLLSSKQAEISNQLRQVGIEQTIKQLSKKSTSERV